MRGMLRSMLSSIGVAEIDTAINGREAIEALERKRYDVIAVITTRPRQKRATCAGRGAPSTTDWSGCCFRNDHRGEYAEMVMERSNMNPILI